MVRPKKYHTEEERREAIRKNKLKYYHAHREATVYARRAKRSKSKQAAVKAGQKET